MSSRAGSDRARRAAIRLLRWYPIRWRARYEREMKALLEDMPVGWGQVANVAGVGLREWFSPRAFGWPSPSSANQILGLRWRLFIGLTYSVDMIARLIAAGLVKAHVSISPAFEETVSLLSLALFIRIAIAPLSSLKTLGKSPRAVATVRHHWPGYLSDREIIGWLLAFVLPYLVIGHAASGDPFGVNLGIFLLWLWMYFMLQASKHNQRLKRIHRRSLRQSLRILNIPGVPR